MESDFSSCTVSGLEEMTSMGPLTLKLQMEASSSLFFPTAGLFLEVGDVVFGGTSTNFNELLTLARVIVSGLFLLPTFFSNLILFQWLWKWIKNKVQLAHRSVRSRT